MNLIITEEAAPDELDDGAKFMDVNIILELEGGEELIFFLPPHQRCVTHILNLIATNEVDKAASMGPCCTDVQRLNVLQYGTRHTSHQQLQKPFKMLPT